MRDERRVTQRHRVSIVKDLVDRVLLAAGLHRLQQGHVVGHCHYLRTGHLLDQGITFLVIPMGVIAQQYLDVGELEPELRHRLLDRWHVAFICAVDQEMSLRRHDEKRAERIGADVVDVADDPVGRKRRYTVGLRAHVTRQYRTWRIGLSLDGDGRMVGRRHGLCEACVRTEDERTEETYE